MKRFLPLLIGAMFPALAPADDALERLREREKKVQAVVEKVMPSVVAIIGQEGGMSAAGSGVVVSEDGLIMTAGHVTDAAGRELMIVFPDGRRVKGESLGANLSRDAGLARIVEEGTWPTASIGDSNEVDLGDWVVALGHPGGYDLTRTPPVRLGRVVNVGVLGMIGTDCTLVGGDSGGPLFNLEGEIIGIHSSIGGSLAENRHVPASVYEADRERMLGGEVWGSLGMMSAGLSPDRPMLGVQMGQGRRGVVIEGFVNGSPAEAAGVEVGDVIIGIDGMEVRNRNAFADYVSGRRAGDVVEIKVRRGDGTETIGVKLARWEDLAGGIRRPGGDQPPAAEPAGGRGGKPRLGVFLDRESDAEGAAIHEVIEGSPAADAGLLAGDVVVEIDGRPVADVAAMESMFGEMEVGDEIAVKVRRGDAEEQLSVTLGKR